jgi:Do/DeqQ family serine protease
MHNPKPMSRNTSQSQPLRLHHLRHVAASLVLVLFGTGLAGCNRIVAPSAPNAATPNSQNTPAAAPNPAPNSTTPAPTSGGIVPTNFVTDVVSRVGPAVVRIDTKRTVTGESVPDEFNDPFFRRFFGDRVPVQPDRRTQSGTGSGFILDAKGQIVTNAHVVEGVDDVTVTLNDGRTLPGKVVGRDPVTDVAVVKVDQDNLPTVSLGNSDNLKPGEWAIAIGNPLGLDNTVTTGIISATGRSSRQVGIPDKQVRFIQTDAAINPGNSGGPLLDQNGNAIGMNTAIVQGAQGLGFAIPINTVKQIVQQLVATGKAQHPYLGIHMVTLSPEIKEQINRESKGELQVKQDRGVLILRVVEGSPAAAARLRPGDIIQKINGNTVENADDVQQAVSQTQVGSSLSLEVDRNGTTATVNVTAGSLPDKPQE